MSLLATSSDQSRQSEAVRSGGLKQRVFEMLERDQKGSRLSRSVDVFLVTLIVLSVIAIVLESVSSLFNVYGNLFLWFEAFTVIVFTIEYLLRIWSCAVGRRGMAALSCRLRFIVSAPALIDLIAILPFYLMLGGQVDMRFLRVFRLLRVFKLTRYSAAFDVLQQALKENARSLMAALFVLMMVMLVAATGMYYFEGDAQPVAFSSIPAAMWWAFATLTTVGYGDVTPITTGGRVFGALITVLGVGMVALPTGILASAYTEQLRRRSESYRQQADAALSDGVLSGSELDELEALRCRLGLEQSAAQQILGLERARLTSGDAPVVCPQCGGRLP